jgi:hypothetical protein
MRNPQVKGFVDVDADQQMGGSEYLGSFAALSGFGGTAGN